MTFALPSSPHWAPTTTVTGMATLQARRTERVEILPRSAVGRPVASAGVVMRRMTWAAMDESARAALCARGLEAIFDASLKAAIGMIIDDVREHGNEALCRALHDFDGVHLTPGQLRATDDELDSARVDDDVDAAIDDAITHLR